jgi:threonine synthase
MGEGGTPLLQIAGLSDLGEIPVYVKWEGRNPTGSHKDRFSAFAVSRALHSGKKKVACASSGNAGLSVASYARYAGLEAEIAITADVANGFRDYLDQFRAVVTECDNSIARWELIRKLALDPDTLPITNYSLPAVGSNPFGVEGYKLIAEELVADPRFDCKSWIIIPTSRGDLAWGIYLGFHQLCGEIGCDMPKICAVEPFARVSSVLAGEDYRKTFEGESHGLLSIAGNTTTYQLLQAIKSTKGTAIVINEPEAEVDRQILWQHGLPCERSSAATLSALRKLRQAHMIGDGETAVLIATGSGLRGLDGRFKCPIAL